MTNHVIYFHGYGSTPESSKVDMLREELSSDYSVHAFPIDIDPDKAHLELTEQIDNLLLEDMHSDDKVLFVGTSLGGWWASKLGVLYGISAIVINPPEKPSESLSKYGEPETITSKYEDFTVGEDNVYFFAEEDSVIDNLELRKRIATAGLPVFIVKGATHRFNGKDFSMAISVLKNMIES